MKQYRVAVVGAPSMLGQEFLKILEQRDFPVDDIHLYSVEAPAGRKLFFRHREVPVAEANHEAFVGIDMAFFCGDVYASRHFVPSAVRAGVIVVDSSDAWRMEGDAPLVVPEVNIEDAASHKGIIVNPTCTVIELAMVLAPLNRVNPARRVIATTYQAVSGAGAAALDELKVQARQVMDGQPTSPKALPYQIAFNVLPEVDVFLDTGYTKEERKLIEETRRVLHAPEIEVSATCVRVPVLNGHCIAAHIEFTHPFPPDTAREILGRSPGIRVQDDTSIRLYPQPWTAAGRDECYVGRIRQDSAFKNGLTLWIVMDNMRKGGALNAVQIFEEMMKRGWLAPGGRQ